MADSTSVTEAVATALRDPQDEGKGRATTETRFKHIFVVVHGIGDQQRNATVREVATRLATSDVLKVQAFAPESLGYFFNQNIRKTQVSPADGKLVESAYGVAEVYWADIPRKVAEDDYTLEEIKAWGRTLAARARETYLRSTTEEECGKMRAIRAKLGAYLPTASLAEARQMHMEAEKYEVPLKEKIQQERRKLDLIGPDFGLATEVIDEIVDSLQLLENLSWVADKAGLFKFDVSRLLKDFVGDVQLVTEFTYHRHDILGRFQQALRDIAAAQKEIGNDDYKIHIVAHSEGTVVAFFALLHALSGQALYPKEIKDDGDLCVQESSPPGWLSKVHGLMTIGSPIDKHLLLWERLTRGLDLKRFHGFLPSGQIRWRNYYDKGDPVGFDLNTARLWLTREKGEAFEFCNCKNCQHDQGFARYLLPGKAHNDYWEDPEVFENFIGHVVDPDLGAANQIPKVVGNRGLAGIVSPLIPYAGSVLLLVLGTWLLYKQVTEFTHPALSQYQKFVLYNLGVPDLARKGVEGFDLFRSSCGLAALIAGTTIAARLPRLAIGMWWRAAISWIVGAALYVCLLSDASQQAIGAPIADLTPSFLLNLFHALPLATESSVVLFASLFVVAIGLSGKLNTKRKGLAGAAEREQRWFAKGARPLIISGAIVIFAFVVAQITSAGTIPADADKTEQLLQSMAVKPAAWPVLLGGLAFLYLWWLATLVLDLAFVWNRYVRGGVALQRLRGWKRYGAAGGPTDPPRCTPAAVAPAP